jgi:hypothetical protein
VPLIPRARWFIFADTPEPEGQNAGFGVLPLRVDEGVGCCLLGVRLLILEVLALLMGESLRGWFLKTERVADGEPGVRCLPDAGEPGLVSASFCA